MCAWVRGSSIWAAGWKRRSWSMREGKSRKGSASTIKWRAGCTGAGSASADIHSPLPFPDGRFDHVVMFAVLEHLPSPEPVLREAHRVIAPGGSLIRTWPSALVDPALNVLHALHMISEEMESDEHQRRIPVEEFSDCGCG